MMRFILALMVVGTTMAIQSPSLYQTGFVTTMVEYAPNDNSCSTPVAVTYQPIAVCIAALKVGNTYPTVTPPSSTTSVTYQSYIYSVTTNNAVFISYYTDSTCVTPVSLSQSPGTLAADTPATALGCTIVGAVGNAPSNGGGGWEYAAYPFTYTATAPTTLGNVPMSIFNTYANNQGTNGVATGVPTGYSSCSGLPTQVTMQNIAITQMAPFSSGNTCAKTACMAITTNGQPNGAVATSSNNLNQWNNNNVVVNQQTTCTVPTVSSQNGYFLRNYYTVSHLLIHHSLLHD